MFFMVKRGLLGGRHVRRVFLTELFAFQRKVVCFFLRSRFLRNRFPFEGKGTCFFTERLRRIFLLGGRGWAVG